MKPFVAVYDEDLQHELDSLLEIQWRDNVKARVLDTDLTNQVRHTNAQGDKPVRSQIAMEKWLRKQSRKAASG